MLRDETITERLKAGVSNQLQRGSREVSEGSSNGALANGHPGNGKVSLMVVGPIEGRRKADKPLWLQGQKELSAGHTTKLAVGLYPIPLPTERPRDLLSPPDPIVTNSGFDLGKLLFGNCSLANREWQRIQRIAKQNRGHR